MDCKYVVTVGGAVVELIPTDPCAAEFLEQRRRNDERSRVENEQAHNSAMRKLHMERALLNDPDIRGVKGSDTETGFEVVNSHNEHSSGRDVTPSFLATTFNGLGWTVMRGIGYLTGK